MIPFQNDDLQAVPMSRAVELGQEGSVYISQPNIIAGVMPSALNHPASNFYNQPIVPASVYQLQPHIPASVYQMQPQIPASVYQMQPQIPASVYQMQPEINAENFDDVLESGPVTMNQEITGTEPTYYNRPLEIAPMRFHRREIEGTDPILHVGHIPFGVPQTHNIIPDDDEEGGEGTTVPPESVTETTIGSSVTPPILITTVITPEATFETTTEEEIWSTLM